jgi:hypothetical protein
MFNLSARPSFVLFSLPPFYLFKLPGFSLLEGCHLFLVDFYLYQQEALVLVLFDQPGCIVAVRTLEEWKRPAPETILYHLLIKHHEYRLAERGSWRCSRRGKACMSG